MARVKSQLDTKTTLIGFCGAPWTVATYMVAGEATPDQAPARLFAYRDPEGFGRLIDRLVEGSIEYLVGQLKAGAEVVQIFDTWAGVLSPEQFDRWCIQPTEKIVAGVRHQVPGAKIIGFPRGAGAMTLPLRGRHWRRWHRARLDFPARTLAADMLQPRVTVQGNVDPLACCRRSRRLDREVDDVMTQLSGKPLIFNPATAFCSATRSRHVERMLKRVAGANDDYLDQSLPHHRRRVVDGRHALSAAAVAVYHAAQSPAPSCPKPSR